MPARILLLVQISTIAKRTKQKECLREKQTQEMYVCDQDAGTRDSGANEEEKQIKTSQT